MKGETSKKLLSEKLAADVDRFLRKGGEIQQVGVGATGNRKLQFTLNKRRKDEENGANPS